MLKLDVLARDGVIEVLRKLCLGEARFKELNEVVSNTRTLTMRLKELSAEGLIQKAGAQYKITNEGFDTTTKIAEFEGKTKQKWINHEGFTKVRYGWLRVSLTRLTQLFHKEFENELISIVLYGSAVKDSFQLGRSDVDLLYILEDDSRNVWQREESVFKDFQYTWEYRACNYWLKMLGLYGYPEATTASLLKSHAKTFQPIYLDILSHRAVLYDKEGFFQKLMKKLEEALKALGTIRIEHPDRTYGWLLKPDITPGESIEINLE